MNIYEHVFTQTTKSFINAGFTGVNIDFDSFDYNPFSRNTLFAKISLALMI